MTKAQVEVITSVQRRRRWSRAEKERIVAAAMEPGAVASEVARAAGIHTSQLFRWRQQLCERGNSSGVQFGGGHAGACSGFLGIAREAWCHRDRVCQRRADADFRAGRFFDGIGADEGAGEGQAAAMIRPRAAREFGWRPATPTCARALMAWRCWCRRRSSVILTAGICSCSVGAAAG